MDTTATNSQSVITADMEIKGNIKTNGSVQIDGKIEGDLACGRDVALGKAGAIKGNVAASSLVIEGAVDGNVVARERVELKSSARINGDLKAKRFCAEEGVTLSGKIEIIPGPPAETAAPAAPAERTEERPALADPVRTTPYVASVTPRQEPRGGVFPKR